MRRTLCIHFLTLSIDYCTHGQTVVCNGAIVVPPHDIGIRHVGYTSCKKLKRYGLGLVSNNITSIPDFMKIRTAIFELLHAYRRTSSRKQHSKSMTSRMDNGVFIVHLTTLSIRYVCITNCKLKEYCCGLGFSGTIFIPNCIKIHSSFPEIHG
jgi:hypothetical protein